MNKNIYFYQTVQDVGAYLKKQKVPGKPHGSYFTTGSSSSLSSLVVLFCV